MGLLKHEMTSTCVHHSAGGIRYTSASVAVCLCPCSPIMYLDILYSVPSTGLVSRDIKRAHTLFLPLNTFDFPHIMLCDSAEVLLTTFRLKHLPGLSGHQGFKVSIHHAAHLCNEHVHSSSPASPVGHLDLFSRSYLYERRVPRPTGKHPELSETISAVSSYVRVPDPRQWRVSATDSGTSSS